MSDKKIILGSIIFTAIVLIVGVMLVGNTTVPQEITASQNAKAEALETKCFLG